ncbi:hypothetical protein Micbo1qcDRAFT_197817 [Microdochium bolleyi]|uniref:Zn(2)-C6 fungal-type domain-containing protein n=1 Tax=Microdochium bolleyi TaxID=196109 RepID=A0A136IRP0_9PEZI|nr:hypothetical protein Micbo1qcDRAFT_197817 [Microdochium bolleyi]
MHQVSDLFFCPICDKPFTKESTRDRHKPYCRRVRSGTKPRRQRACKHCRQAKLKCDFADPCNTCNTKALTCSYEHGQPQNRQPAIRAGRAEPASTPDKVPVSDAENVPLDLALPSNFTIDDTWDILDFSLDAFPPTPVSLDLQSNAQTKGTYDSLQELIMATSQPSSIIYFSTPPPLLSLSSPYNHSPFIPRNVSPSWRHFLASNLRSYPRMMLQLDTLPPFIHPHNYQLSLQSNIEIDSGASTSSSADASEHHPGAFLANCVAVCQLLSTKTPASDAMFWRVLQGELHAIEEQTPHLTIGQTIGAGQALMVYIIIRLVECGGDYLLNDFSMFYIMRGLHRRVEQLTSEQQLSSTSTRERDVQTRWHEWILLESRRRHVVICFLIRLVISPESFDSISDINLLVLPADKALWEARTAAEWEYRYTSSQGHHGQHVVAPLALHGNTSNVPPEIRVLGDLAAVQKEVVAQNLGRMLGSGVVVGGGRNGAYMQAGRLLDEWNMRQDGLGVFLSAVTAAAAS